MAIQNESNLATANTVAQAKFSEVFGAPPVGVSTYFTESYNSSALTDEFAFLAKMGTFSEWLNDRVSNNVAAFRQSIACRFWEDTLELPRKFVDYDTSGAVAKSISQWIENAKANFDDKMIFDALVANTGSGPVGFDSLNLLATTHAMGDYTGQSNKTTSALSFSTFDTAIQTIAGYRNMAGEYISPRPYALVVGPKLMRTAMEIANADSVPVTVNTAGAIEYPGTAQTGNVSPGSGIFNVYKGQVDVVVWNRLAGTQDDYWYILSDVGGAKPMLLKNNRDWTLVTQTEDTSPRRWNADVYQWGLEADKAPAAGVWPCIYGGIL